jgi:1-acyl-sn-glycerol-3-phosphate acyltransferase
MWLAKLFMWIIRWKIDPIVPEAAKAKCVLVAAPHTSNWDQPITVAAMKMLGVTMRYTIKKEWLRFPLGWFIRMTGGIGIDRSPKKAGEERQSMVDAIADLYPKYEQLAVIIPPEGSRSLRTEWKTGFYYTALKAQVPIALGYLDYKKKIAGIGKMIYPSGNFEADMREIMAFYANKAAKFPEKFSLDVRYLPNNPAQNDPVQP